jgi:hypothetical protein
MPPLVLATRRPFRTCRWLPNFQRFSENSFSPVGAPAPIDLKHTQKGIEHE